MSSEQLADILSQLKRWSWQRTVSPLAADAVLRSVVTSGITDSVEVVAVACDAIVRWSIVYDLYEEPNADGFPAEALRSALHRAVHDVAQETLASLLEALGNPERVHFEAFIVVLLLLRSCYREVVGHSTALFRATQLLLWLSSEFTKRLRVTLK
ncbi:hypothetical protein HPB50_020801 [Hyalomma asiaticum]|uniref:Uncharacterized protein n=1 Tax=Hyalomma asiaticum TaxID=266040 RepID=A0ACB7TB46_HYAAI|nr:hypothetical protein HPB50_020801 [Hyalomma asiaticum]